MNMKIFSQPAVKLSLNTALVYGVAFAGRSYLQINPLHAALFSLATHIASYLGKKLAKKITDNGHETFIGRSVEFVAANIAVIPAIAYKVFSPVQAIAAVGLDRICSSFYYTVTARSSWL